MGDGALEALWKNVLDHWEQDAAHQAFLEHCQENDQLVAAAVRYRGMVGDRDRGPSAEKRLKGVSVLAIAKLEAHRTPAAAARSDGAKVAMIVVFLAASLATLAYLFTQR